jgi:hypothetical protein
MPPTMSYLRSVLTLAFLVVIAIFAWRVSTPAATLLGDMHVHLQASLPHPAKLPAPKMTSVPKLAPITCHP